MNAFENYIVNNYNASFLNIFERYYLLYTEFNNRINISSIREKEDVYTKHFLDSVYPAKYFKGSCLDVGCGGGFPSVPLCILNKNIKFTAIDGVNKKLEFVRQLKSEFSLDNLCIEHARSEEMKATFDTVTARAVAPFEKLLKFCMPRVKPGGSFVAFKSITEDLNINLLKPYNAFVKLKLDYILPETDLNRRIYIICKRTN